MILFDSFPGGKQNAVTFSYDDGMVTGDERLIALFRKYGLKATFHLNGLFADTAPETLRARYDGFEIAAHGKEHRSLSMLPVTSIIEELTENRKVLERAVRGPVQGLSYANGDFTQEMLPLLRSLGFVYSRTTRNRVDRPIPLFGLPEDFMQWAPTCHQSRGQECADKFVASLDGYFSTPRLLDIWGHSHELRTEEDWAKMEQICATMAHNDRVWYATNGEIYNYVMAQRALVPAADESFIYNPTRTDVWFHRNNVCYCVHGGETLFF